MSLNLSRAARGLTMFALGGLAFAWMAGSQMVWSASPSGEQHVTPATVQVTYGTPPALSTSDIQTREAAVNQSHLSVTVPATLSATDQQTREAAVDQSHLSVTVPAATPSRNAGGCAVPAALLLFLALLMPVFKHHG